MKRLLEQAKKMTDAEWQNLLSEPNELVLDLEMDYLLKGSLHPYVPNNKDDGPEERWKKQVNFWNTFLDIPPSMRMWIDLITEALYEST